MTMKTIGEQKKKNREQPHSVDASWKQINK